MAGSDTTDRFLQESRLRTEHLRQTKKKGQFFTYLSNFEKGKEAVFQQRRALFVWKMLTRCSQKKYVMETVTEVPGWD